jgi:lipoprotein-anchoring transpeptidase ErfK/SrfK
MHPRHAPGGTAKASRAFVVQGIIAMHIPMGQHMTQLSASDRRLSSGATGALVFAGALFVAPLLFTGNASAQVLGYASTPPGALPSDGAMTPLPPSNQEGVVPERLRRAVVGLDTREASGTVIIDTGNTALYYVLGQGRAIRYGVGVGREGFTWSGVQTISRKAEWPDWYPPAEMIARQPYLPRFVAGGPGNPLGARAMYLGTSQYRIHGTNDPSTIGKFVSSGCIRLTNEDVADLFSRVDVGSKVVVLPKNAPHLEARASDTRTVISVRPLSPPRAAVTTSPSGRQAMNISMSALY